MSSTETTGASEPLNILNGLLRSTPSRRAIVFGAGFSKAISAEMPINDQLGDLAVARARIDNAPAFAGGRFETWLSRLAETQPDLAPAVNAANRAHFLAIADAIHQVIIDAENAACSQRLPAWLCAFVTAAHFDQSVIITFNYDTLIERAVGAAALGVPDQTGYLRAGNELGWIDTYAGVPPMPPTRWGGDEVPTLRLLKLHGSVHWYWVTGDATGATLHHASLENSPAERRREHPGRQPFIVPPSALKSSYFQNPVVSQLWADAAGGIRQASHFDLVGYSLPLTDLTAAGMIADSINPAAIVTVANPDPDGSVVTNVTRVIGRAPTTLDGAHEYVAEFVADRSRQVVADFVLGRDRLAPNALVRIGWNRQQMVAATRVNARGDVLEVHAAPFTDPADRAFTADDTQRAERLRTLTGACRLGMQIHAMFDDGSRSPIVGVERFGADHGRSTHWQLLVPAHRPGDVTTNA